MPQLQIPKKLHLIWLGDKGAPAACIASWKDNHQSWQFKLWGKSELRLGDWVNKAHMGALARRNNWPAVAALMRYEILHREGGVVANSEYYSIRALDAWLLENEMFLFWKDTLSRSALVNDAVIGSIPGNPFLEFVIGRIKAQSRMSLLWSWSRIYSLTVGAVNPVGPYQLTRCIRQYGESGYK